MGVIKQSNIAILRVDEQIYADLGRPLTLEDWHRALLLPDDFYVIDAKKDASSFNSLYNLSIAHKDIPLNTNPDHMQLNVSYIVGYIEGQRQPPVLSEITISQWGGGTWKDVKIIKCGDQNAKNDHSEE